VWEAVGLSSNVENRAWLCAILREMVYEIFPKDVGSSTLWVVTEAVVFDGLQVGRVLTVVAGGVLMDGLRVRHISTIHKYGVNAVVLSTSGLQLVRLRLSTKCGRSRARGMGSPMALAVEYIYVNK
jgi:hypothetical protein